MSDSNVPNSKPSIRLVTKGDAPVRIWGLANSERIGRLAEKSGVTGGADAPTIIWADASYAFDPVWMSHLIAHPGTIVTSGGRPVLAHVDGDMQTQLEAGIVPEAQQVYRMEDAPEIYNSDLRKSQHPFCEALSAENVRHLERESYYGAYKGVTDILTKYLWPEIAYHLTRWAAYLRMTPNMITFIGAAFCVLATFLFAYGYYWTGTAAGFVFMVLDTVDGKLARCTITSSWWGNIFDHGMDLVHPPFWWYFWAVGLYTWGLAYDDSTFWIVQAIIWGGYIVQRLIEGYFIRRFGFHIHVWRKIDSDFRLITARRNPNMVLLIAGLIFARPDLGLMAVAAWTLISLLVHAWQVVQAEAMHARGQKLTSWLGQ